MKQWILFVAAITIASHSFAQTDVIEDGAVAEANKFVAQILTVGKMSGLCGAFRQMATFQETTKLENGDQFVVRFAKAEAARLGLDVKEFFQSCDEALETYRDLAEMAGLE
tara:strand:+ start:12498 stop:12830 length:333 start_codon:yes stop_codon:yes gene_type:complete